MAVRGSILILLVSVLFPTTMIITFYLAVSSEHVYPIMPFMSYTGDRPIESCIFSLGLNVIAVLYIIICFIRYNQIVQFFEAAESSHGRSILRMNRKSLPWGILAAVGLSVTGSFQELHAATAHRLGAIVCTYCSFVYFWYQTFISDLLADRLNSKSVAFLRTVLSIASTAVHLAAPILVGILDVTYPRCHEDTLLWSIDEEGWHLHVCCSFMEWTIFFLNIIYIATFYPEFEHVRIYKDEIVFDNQNRRIRRNMRRNTDEHPNPVTRPDLQPFGSSSRGRIAGSSPPALASRRQEPDRNAARGPEQLKNRRVKSE